MERKVTKNAFMALGLSCFLLVMIPAAAFSWNQVTHVYIADRLGERVGHDDLNKMWGSVAPDFFNYIFDPALCPGWVSDQTHGTCSDTFLKVSNAASSDKEDALAFGFVSHNQAWGADCVAHISGLRPGYVEIVKAAMFSAMGICDDYLTEINATIEFVGKNLEGHGITYLIHGNPK